MGKQITQDAPGFIGHGSIKALFINTYIHVRLRLTRPGKKIVDKNLADAQNPESWSTYILLLIEVLRDDLYVNQE